MPQKQTIAATIQRGSGMLAMHLADFTDADLRARPVPAANHAAYQICHLLNANNRFLQAIGGDAARYDLPPAVAAVTKADAASDDPSRFPPKADLLAAHEGLTAKLLTLVNAMTDADLDAPTPESIQSFAATKAAAALMVPLHTTMHIGQIQVIRRALGKPVLF